GCGRAGPAPRQGGAGAARGEHGAGAGDGGDQAPWPGALSRLGLLPLIALPGQLALAFFLPRHACLLLLTSGDGLISETSRIVPAMSQKRRRCYRFVAWMSRSVAWNPPARTSRGR